MDTQQHNVVIVGGGLAGFHVASKLVQLGYSGGITLVGEEPWPPYDRPPLSKQYQVDGDEPAIWLAPELPSQVRQLRERKAVSIDTVACRLHLDEGNVLPWDKLVIATGARARLLPHLQPSSRVRTLRTLGDAQAIRATLKSAGSLLVVGGGPIGLELAATAKRLGVSVAVVEIAPRLMGRCVPAAMSEAVLERHRSSGIAIHLGRTVTSIDESAGEALLDDGQRLPAGLVVVGVGVVANDQLAADAGIACDDGIFVDPFGRTTTPGIFAAGDVTRQRHPVSRRFERIETWSNAQGQAHAVANFIARPGEAKPFDLVPWFWSDQGEMRLQCAGGIRGDMEAWRHVAGGGRLLVQWTGGCVTGVAALNAPRDFVQLKRLIVPRSTVTPEQFSACDGNMRALVQDALAT